jgi:prolyl-tRNA synthetase
MVHGDDQGLIMPPRLAPYQVVIVPIYKNDAERGPVLETMERLKRALTAAGLRVRVDDREDLTPGFKFNDWELRGVPVRLEVGPKDVTNGVAALARRDRPGKAGKTLAPQAGLAQVVAQTLNDIHQALYSRALDFRQAHTFEPGDYAEFKQAVETGWAYAWWCGDRACEAAIKDDTRATTRCIPFEQPGGGGVCIRCGRPATEKAYFARAY